jgi:hypothetical protein
MSREMRAILAAILERAGLAPAAKGAMAVLRWPEFVGTDIAAHARAQSVRRGVLTVMADSNVWATELSTYIPVLLERIRLALGDGVVSDIRFLVGRGRDRARSLAFGLADPEIPPQTPWPNRRDLAAVQLTGEDQKRIRRFTEEISDPDLARAAERWLALTLKARRWLGKASDGPGA